MLDRVRPAMALDLPPADVGWHLPIHGPAIRENQCTATCVATPAGHSQFHLSRRDIGSGRVGFTRAQKLRH